MPSRKKAKGKARKEAKKAKARDEESRAVVEMAANKRQGGSLEAQLHQLVISDIAPRICEHGLVQLSAGEEKICLEFINTHLAAFSSHEDVASPEDVAGGFFNAYHATQDEYTDVYASKLDKVVSMLLASGTQRILEGDKRIAQRYGSLACYFEELIAVRWRKTQSYLKSGKVFELESSDDHTLVSYYRKRIPCSCLDEKYKEVKSIKKMGCCFNPSCRQPGGKVERSKMLSCTQCGMANYCSVECQRADWKRHGQSCGNIAERKASFSSSQT